MFVDAAESVTKLMQHHARVFRIIGIVAQPAIVHCRLVQWKILLVERILTSSGTVKTSLDTYDHAYAQLTVKTNPAPFREFLLSSPARFAELGERLGVLQHLTSFCTFRFPPNRRATIGVEELLDVFNDFEANLYTVETQPQTGTAAA